MIDYGLKTGGTMDSITNDAVMKFVRWHRAIDAAIELLECRNIKRAEVIKFLKAERTVFQSIERYVSPESAPDMSSLL